MAVKNQHHTPRLHLRQFTQDFRVRQETDASKPWWYEDGDGMIFVLDKGEGKRYRANIRNVAAEKFFYDLPDTIEEQIGGPQAVEKRLSDLEDIWNQAGRELFSQVLDVSALLSQKSWSPQRVFYSANVNLKARIATFVAWQVVRTRFFRDFQVDRHLDEHPEKTRPEAEAYVKEYISEWILTGDQLKDFASKLMDQIWVLGLNQEDEPLYTSDQPIAGFFNSGAEVRAGGQSSVPRSVGFIVPLNYRIVPEIFERGHWAVWPIPEYAQALREFDGFIWRMRRRTVSRYNRLQVDGSQHRVFSPTDAFNHVASIASGPIRLP